MDGMPSTNPYVRSRAQPTKRQEAAASRLSCSKWITGDRWYARSRDIAGSEEFAMSFSATYIAICEMWSVGLNAVEIRNAFSIRARVAGSPRQSANALGMVERVARQMGILRPGFPRQIRQLTFDVVHLAATYGVAWML